MSNQDVGYAEKLTRVYIKIRDKKAEVKKAFDEEYKALNTQQEKIKAALLDYCKEHGLESCKTGAGTFFRQVKTRYWTNDWESMYAFIRENQLEDWLEKRLNQTNVKEFLEENPDGLPDCVNVTSEYQINVRKA